MIALGTVSKSLAPALRLGWIASPPALAEPVTRAKQLSDHGSPGLDQLALALFIETGRYDRHLQRMRAEYAARRQVLLQALADHAPGVRLTAWLRASTPWPISQLTQPSKRSSRQPGHDRSGCTE